MGIVAAEKKQLIRRNGILEYLEAETTLDQVGVGGIEAVVAAAVPGVYGAGAAVWFTPAQGDVDPGCAGVWEVFDCQDHGPVVGIASAAAGHGAGLRRFDGGPVGGEFTQRPEDGGVHCPGDSVY